MFMSSAYIKIEDKKQCTLHLSDWCFWISMCSIKSEPAYCMCVVDNSLKIVVLRSVQVSTVNEVLASYSSLLLNVCGLKDDCNTHS
jgi:hypothetical protein